MDERARDDIRRQHILPEADRPASAGAGAHHVALICTDVPRTIDFYQGMLGFPLVEVLENRDYPGSTHLFFDIGGGCLLAFFDFPGLDVAPHAEVLGGLQHLAISVPDEATWDEHRRRLDAAGIAYVGPDRGASRSLYLQGPDGEVIELLRAPLRSMLGTAPPDIDNPRS